MKGPVAWSVLVEVSNVTMHIGLRKGEVLAPVQHLLILLKYTEVRNWQKKMREWHLIKMAFKTCTMAF